MFASEKTKLVAAISVLLVTGFLITSLTSYFVSRASLRAEIFSSELPLTSDNIYSEIQKDLFRPVFISSLMSTDTFLRDWVLAGESEDRQITRYLNEIQQKYNTFTSFFVSEKTKLYYHSDGVLKKVSPDEPRDAWYFRVRDMKTDYEINIDPDIANKDAMTIFINYRVFDYDHNYIGATGVGLTVNAVKKLIETYQGKYKRAIYFFDKKGEIKLTGSRSDPSIKHISQLDFAPRFMGKPDIISDTSFTYRKDGEAVHANIRYVEEFGWYLVVEQPEKDIVRQIFITLIMNLFICVGITIIVLILVNLSVTAYQKRIETLRGIVPICSFCKQIRDDKGYWNRVEAYVAKYTDAKFSHSVCPACMKEHYPVEYAAIQKKKNTPAP